MRRRGGGVLYTPPGVTVDLCLALRGERAAGGRGRRVAGAGSLDRVPPHADVLPASLRKRRAHSGWQRETARF